MVARVLHHKCGAALQLPADRIAFEQDSVLEFEARRIAVDITGWAQRNGDGHELCCPFHGSARYPLEYVAGPGAVDEFDDHDDGGGGLDDDELDDDEPLHGIAP